MSDVIAVYQLKVTIKDIHPPIWRRLLLPSNATFWELHIAIQDSFGWDDYHLHQFFIGPTWDRNTLRVAIPRPDDFTFEDEKEPLDESKTHLSQYLTELKPKIMYVYDFGDNWEHQIVLEKTLPYAVKDIYPQVILGKRACPWEDCGGPWGYQNKIKRIKSLKKLPIG